MVISQDWQDDNKDGRTLTKLQREAMFNEAESLRFEGKHNESADIYMRCLFSMDVKTAFPSLPRCLRALANYFLENKQYIKAVHFVQAERLYYESALIDTASLQQRLIGMVNVNERIVCPLADIRKQDIDHSQRRLEEYNHLIEYFKEKNKFEIALRYANKNVKLMEEVYGENCDQVKGALSIIKDLEVEISRERNVLMRIGDIDDKPKIDENDRDPETHYQSYLGFSPNVPYKNVSDLTESTVSVQNNLNTVAGNNTKIKTLKTVVRFVLLLFVFIFSSTILLILVYQLLMALHKVFVSEIFMVKALEKVSDSRPFMELLKDGLETIYHILYRLIFRET